jgi:hypothetical protein
LNRLKKLPSAVVGFLRYTRSLWMLPTGGYSLHIAPAAARVPYKTTTMEKYINFVAHPNSHGNALVPYRVHLPMEEVQGFTRSHLEQQSDIPMPVFFHRQVVENGCKVTEWPY